MPTTSIRSVASPAAVLAALHPDDLVDRWERLGLHELADAELAELAAAVVAVPRSAPADSFVLHAPLELMARVALLPHVDPGSRVRARQRIAWVASTFARNGPPAETPRGESDHDPDPEAGTALARSIAAGDVEAADRAVSRLVRRGSAEELVAALAPVALPSLAAAGHGTIFCSLLPHAMPRSRAAAAMGRGIVREIARQPAWVLSWMKDRPTGTVPTSDLVARLLRPESPGDPGSDFVFPTMSLVERSGLARHLLDAPTRGLAVAVARRDLLRVAAWSMLQDHPERAPYGWSHCLTMPQAALAVAPHLADASDAVAVAATYVLGFRATLGAVAVDPSWAPAPLPADPGDGLLDAGSEAAASAMWHADAEAHRHHVRRVATFAALHPDAHLAKYTLACLDAGRADREAGRLFTAAAAYLAAWWRGQPGASDRIG